MSEVVHAGSDGLGYRSEFLERGFALRTVVHGRYCNEGSGCFLSNSEPSSFTVACRNAAHCIAEVLGKFKRRTQRAVLFRWTANREI